MNQSSGSRWHALPPDEVLGELEASRQGLDEAETARRLAEYGPNRFERTPPKSAWVILQPSSATWSSASWSLPPSWRC